MARHLAGPALASGWGAADALRSHGGVQPDLVPRGLGLAPRHARWPARGCAATGSTQPALGLAGDLIDALALFDDRLPELFGGHDREPGDVPVPYPTACRPQAWAAGVPLQLATMFLGLEPDVPDGRVALGPRCRLA